jgi:hypothetical protein
MITQFSGERLYLLDSSAFMARLPSWRQMLYNLSSMH